VDLFDFILHAVLTVEDVVLLGLDPRQSL